MRAAVAEADDRVRMREHLADRVEVAVGVVEGRQVEERVAAVAEHDVVREVGSASAFALGPTGDARRRVGLVVGRIAELVHAVQRVEEGTAELGAVAPLGVGREHTRLEGGIGHDAHPLGQWERGGSRRRPD